MLYVNAHVDKSKRILFYVFCAWVAIVLLNRANAVIKRGFVYFKGFWNIVDMIILLLSITIIILFMLRINELHHLLQILELSDHNEFIAYFHLFQLNDAIQFIAAILIFLGTVRLYKLLSFLRMFKLFENTMWFGLGSYFGLIFYHLIIMIAFTTIGTLSFGERMEGFKNPRVTAQSLMRIYMANFHEYDFHVHHESYSHLGVFVITMYMALVKPIYRFFVAAELVAYADAGLYEVDADSYSFLDHIRDEYRFLVSVYRSKIKRLRGGRDTKNKVKQKEHDIFYQNCVSTTTSSIKKMSYIAMILLRNLAAPAQTAKKDKLTEGEAKIMLQVCHYFLVRRSVLGDQKEVFFKTHSREEGGKKRLRLVDHRRMTAARFIIETLLTSAKEKPPKDVLIREQETVMRENLAVFDAVQESLKKCLVAAKAITVR